MRLFKQKILSLVTAVCMIATSAAPVFAAEGATGDVTDSGYVQAIWTDDGIDSVKFIDSGAAEYTFKASEDVQTVAKRKGKLVVTTKAGAGITDVKVAVDKGEAASITGGNNNIWTYEQKTDVSTTEETPTTFTITVDKEVNPPDEKKDITSVSIKKGDSVVTTATVGDTLTASVDPTDAENHVDYQWLLDDKEIDKATSKTFTLTEAHVGEIKVKATVKTDDTAYNPKSLTSDGVTVSATPVEDKVITSFNTSDLTLAKNEHLDTFDKVKKAYTSYFPAKVTGTCGDNTSVSVPVTSWDCTSYTSAKGDYTAVAALEVPNGYKLGETADGKNVAATVTIKVTEAQTAEKTITAFNSIGGVNGGKVGAITSGYEPENVAKTLLDEHGTVSATVDSQTETIPVISWTYSKYDVTTAGTYTFTANLDLTGYTLDASASTPTIEVTIDAKDKITLQEVEEPTVTLNSDEHLNTWALLTASGKLPKTVKLTGANNETANAEVSWTDPGSYSGATTTNGPLNVTGIFTLPSDWDNTAGAVNAATLKLVVNAEQTASNDGIPVSTLNIRTDNPTSGMEISKWGVNVLETSATLADTSWSPSHTKFQAGTSYTLTATLRVKDGFKFTNATTVNIIDGNSKTSSMNVSDRTETSLTCSYTFPAVEAKYVTVTFLMDDGKTYATQQVKENTILTAPTPPTKTGFTFIGWFTTNGKDGVQFDFGTAFKANTTLYAKFAPEVSNTQKEALKDAVQTNDSTQAATAVEAIQEAAKGDPAAVKEIIEKSGLSENDIKKLEELYAKGANIESEGDVKKAANVLPTGATITVDGGELNATAPDQKVTIEVSDTHIDQEVQEEALAAHKIPADATVVSLDISLLVGGNPQSTSVTPITITMTLPKDINANSNVFVLHILESGQIESIPVTINADGTFTFTVSSFSDFIVASTPKTINPPTPPTPTPKPDNGNNNNSGGSGGSGGGGGGGGSSGSNKSQSIFQKTTSTINNILKGWFGGASRKVTTGATGAAAVTGTPVTESAAAKAASSAASQAKAQGSNSFNAIVRNATTVSPKAFEAVASQAQKSGLKGYLAADTMKNGAVDVRVSVLASAASRLGKELNLYAVCGNPAIEKHFNKYFSNKTAVISMSQKGSFGVTVNVAAKVNLTGMNVKNLHIYSYDVASNSYRELPQEACFVDGNGYLHFTTDMGGYIVISDGVLTLH